MKLLGFFALVCGFFYQSVADAWGADWNSELHGHLDNDTVGSRRTAFYKSFTRRGLIAPSSLLQLTSNRDDDDDDDDDKSDHNREDEKRKEHKEEEKGDKHPKKDKGPHESKKGVSSEEADYVDKLSPADKEALIHGMIDPAVHFPLLFQMSWQQVVMAAENLRKATDYFDTVMGHMDAIPRDETKIPSVSAFVKIEVSGKALSVADINSKIRAVGLEVGELEGFLSCGRSQVNAKLAKVVPQVPAAPVAAGAAVPAAGAAAPH